MTSERFVCGPLDVSLESTDPAISAKLRETVDLYDVDWQPTRQVTIEAIPIDMA